MPVEFLQICTTHQHHFPLHHMTISYLLELRKHCRGALEKLLNAMTMGKDQRPAWELLH